MTPYYQDKPVMSRFKDGEVSHMIFNKAPDYRPKLRKDKGGT